MKRIIVFFAAVCALSSVAEDSHANIERIEAVRATRECNNRWVVHQGRNDQRVEVFASGSSFQSISISPSGGIDMSVLEHDKVENLRRGKGFISSIVVRFSVSNNAAPGDRTVTVTRKDNTTDTFPIRVVQRATISNHAIEPMSGPFSHVVITLYGQGLSNCTFGIDLDRTRPLKDGAGMDVPGNIQVGINAVVNPQANSDNQVTATINFASSTQFTEAHFELRLHSNNTCGGLYAHEPAGLTYRVKITAPLGPNYVQDAIFDHNDRTYNVGDVVSVTIKLQRPVAAPNQALLQSTVAPTSNRLVANKRGGPSPTVSTGIIFWTILPSNAFEQAGQTGTPFDANATRNDVVVQNGSQTVAINFRVKSCPGNGQVNSVRLVTWKPDAFNDTSPNRREFQFNVRCQ